MPGDESQRSDVKPRRKRAKWGAVIEVAVADGYRYIHWVGASWHCDLVRVLPGVFSEPLMQTDLELLVGGDEAYKMQVFLRDVLRQPNVRVVHHVEPTASQQVIPAMRVVPRAIDRDPDAWYLVDEYTGPQPPPTNAHKELELRGSEYAERHPNADRRQIIPWSIPAQDTFLHMLEIDWRPEQAIGREIYGWSRGRPQGS